VKIGDTVKAIVTVTALNAEKKRATLSTVCTVGDEVVVDGEAYVQVPSRAAVATRS
jgi:3-hydroxybutyryl-CoA dehydratase